MFGTSVIVAWVMLGVLTVQLLLFVAAVCFITRSGGAPAQNQYRSFILGGAGFFAFAMNGMLAASYIPEDRLLKTLVIALALGLLGIGLLGLGFNRRSAYLSTRP